MAKGFITPEAGLLCQFLVFQTWNERGREKIETLSGEKGLNLGGRGSKNGIVNLNPGRWWRRLASSSAHPPRGHTAVGQALLSGR